MKVLYNHSSRGPEEEEEEEEETSVFGALITGNILMEGIGGKDTSIYNDTRKGMKTETI